MAPSVTTRSGKTVDTTKAETVERHGHKFNKEAPMPRPNAHNLDILSGDHGLEEHKHLHDFIWTMSDEPHAKRRKELLKEYGEELKDLRGHEPLTKYIVVVLLAVQIYLGYYLREEALNGGTLKFWVIAYVFGASLAQALFLANHEISHNLAFKGRIPNMLFGIITNMPMLVPYFIAFKEYHNEHHKEQGTDGVDTDLPTELEARLFSSTIGKLFYMFNQTWFYAFRPVFIRPKPFTAWHALNLAVQVGFIYTVYQLWGMGPIWYFLASAHLAGSWHPLASHFIAEHYTFVGEAETASYYGFLNYFTWNVGYHDIHHDFPNIAWSRLPVFRKVAAKYYDKLPYHKSWVGALLHFLFNPNVTMYNRVKREPDTKQE